MKKDKTKKISKDQLYIIIWIVILIIIAWVFFFVGRNNTNNSLGSSSSTTWTVKKWDTVKVDYVWKLTDGTIFDSSIQEFAKKSKNYSASRKYEPLEFTVWAWQMIKWFDAWVIWMKVWDKKTLTISPADGYWEKTIKQEIPLSYIQDKMTQTVPSDTFADTVTRTFPAASLWDKAKTIKVWESIETSWITWKVTALDASWVTIQVDNKQNPFYGKKLIVW